MGLFTFYTADTNRIIEVSGRGKSFPVAVLFPKEFGGGSIEERAYNGYGDFGGKDVYNLIADWNKDYLQKDMLEVPVKENYSEEFYYKMAMKRYETYCQVLDDFKSDKPKSLMNRKFGKDWKRELMINIWFSSDDMPGTLAYPLKIVENMDLTYEEVSSYSRDCDNWML